jgi:hypothetical protein
MQPVWHETNTFDGDQFILETGQPFNQSANPSVHHPRTLRLLGNNDALFQIPFAENIWHNWAVTLDWDSKCVCPLIPRSRTKNTCTYIMSA